MSMPARSSTRRLRVCSASSEMHSTGTPSSVSPKGDTDPNGIPGGSMARVDSVPVVMAAARVRARSASSGSGPSTTGAAIEGPPPGTV